MIQPLEVEAKGFRLITEARLARGGVFTGVFHVLSFGIDEIFDPPVVILVPGQWQSEDDARRAAEEYAIVMANNGALRVAIGLRQTVCG